MKILEYLRRPSAFRSDWWGFTLNQLGHAWVVGFAPVVIFGFGSVPVVLALYVVWEFHQWWRGGAEVWDCVEDTAHVLAGVCIAAFWPVVFAQSAFVAAGALKRHQEERRR